GITAGTYDIVVEALFEGNEELRRFLTETLGGIDGLQGTETSYVLEVEKRAYSVGVAVDAAKNCYSMEECAMLARCEAAVAETGAAAVSVNGTTKAPRAQRERT